MVDAIGEVVEFLQAQSEWPGPGYMWPPRFSELARLDHAHTYSQRADDVGVRAVMASIEHPEAIQSIQLIYADELDLSDLARLPNLREVKMAGLERPADRVHGAWPEGLPIEAVSLCAREFDVEALAGCPTLWHVCLAGNTQPISIRPLLRMPALALLDLSDADVVDIEELASAKCPPVLRLNVDQWRALRATGLRPQLLAGAALCHDPVGQHLGGSRPTIDEAFDWMAWAAPEHAMPGRHIVIRGSASH